MYKLEFYYRGSYVKTLEISLNEKCFLPLEDDIIRLDYKKYRVIESIINYDLHVFEIKIDDPIVNED